jgi:hypothetical protein
VPLHRGRPGTRRYHNGSPLWRRTLPCTQYLILPVGPWLRYFQDIALLVEETTHRVVRALHPVLFRNMAMERSCSPKSPLRTSRFLELFQDLLLPGTRDERCTARPLLRDETVDAVRVKGSDDLSYCAIRQFDRLHHLFPGGTDKEHVNSETSPVRFPIPGLSSCLEIGKGCVFGIGSDIPLSHDP